MALSLFGQIVTPDKVEQGSVFIESGRITDIKPTDDPSDADYNYSTAFIVPGFIDVHMHGQGDYGIFDVEDLLGIAKNQLQFGTIGFLPAAASLAEEKYHQFALNVRQAQNQVPENSALILGAHFEGPFINPLHKGGMDAEFLRLPDVPECQRYLDAAGDVIKIMTLSPELKGSDSVIRLLKQNGIVTSLGHSSASKENLDDAVAAGLTHICHLFNTFEKKKNKDGWQWIPGLLEAILNNDSVTVELICDMQHVLPEYINLSIRACGDDRIVAITDSMQGAGFAPGEYRMTDGREYSTREGIGKLTSNGTVVGSVLTMDKAFANLVTSCGQPIERVSKFTSGNPAKILGLDNELGSIAPGKYADLAILDSDFNCIATFMNGEKVYGD